MNLACIVGRITKDIEVKETSKGTAYTNFTVAVDRIGTEETDFINCTAWSQTAELMEQYLGKGSKVGVTGQLQQNVWEDENGKKHYETYINVRTVDFLYSQRSEDKKEETKKSGKYNRNSRK